MTRRSDHPYLTYSLHAIQPALLQLSRKQASFIEKNTAQNARYLYAYFCGISCIKCKTCNSLSRASLTISAILVPNETNVPNVPSVPEFQNENKVYIHYTYYICYTYYFQEMNLLDASTVQVIYFQQAKLLIIPEARYNTNMETQPENSNISQETTDLLRRNRDLAILYTIAGDLNRKIDVHEALQEVLAQVTKLLGLQTGWVWLLNEQGSPYLAAAQSLPPYLADHPHRMTGYCLCLDTFLQGDLEGAANIEVLRCSRLKKAELESDPTSGGLRFHASVPIYAGETPIGVLNVASKNWRELEPEELQLLHIIGDQIGLAIQRARLSAEHTQAATRLATIEERNRLAREIHDTLAQGLAAITLQLETADLLADSRPQRAHEAIRRALNLARSNLEEARRSVIDLRAAPLQNHTLPEALESLVKQARTESGVDISYSYSPTSNFPPLSPRLEAALYRIAQEALVNALKHAQAQHISLILIAGEDALQLQIQDDGRGFDPDQVTRGANEGHFGLLGMSERVKLLGGNLCISSEPGTGTCIALYAPYE